MRSLKSAHRFVVQNQVFRGLVLLEELAGRILGYAYLATLTHGMT